MTETPDYATYDELSSETYSRTITQAALALKIDIAMTIATKSPYWTPSMHYGAKALADNLIASFELKPAGVADG